MFPELRFYRSIGWDFDDTLIRHTNSAAFWDFIIENPYEQVHHIVTMRSHGLDRWMWEELREEGSLLVRKHFNKVIALPDAIYENFYTLRERGEDPKDHDYYLYKGVKCHENGIDVLIDDMEASSVSLRGCERYGIPHIHPDDLIA